MDEADLMRRHMEARRSLDLAWARQRIVQLEAALLAAKIKHYACDDTYFECPVGCWEDDQLERSADAVGFHVYAVGDPRPDCTCDADRHNAAIDLALKGNDP